MRLISQEMVDELKKQAMAVTWKMDSQGRRVVATKDEMKKIMERSPDGMDAVNLAYYVGEANQNAMPEIIMTRRDPLARRGAGPHPNARR
jgi:hypothetical protein